MGILNVTPDSFSDGGLFFNPRKAVERGLEMAGPILLEPIMRLEVLLPEEFLGSVIGGLQSRHGIVERVEPRGRTQAIIALAPLVAIFGYATDLRSSSQGRGTFTMHFSHYAPKT